MRLSCLILVTVAGLGPSAQAGSQSQAKKMAKRAEAQDLVDAIVRGEGNLNAQLSRAQFLGQEDLISLELCELVRRSDDAQLQRVTQALATLARPNAEHMLLSLTANADSVVRMYAAQGLGRMKSVLAGPAVMPLLSDASLGVRREAARALGLMRFSKAGPGLLKAAKAEGEPEVRAVMLVAIGATGDKRQTAGLESFLDDSSESARLAAAQALCLLGNKKGIELAKRKLSSADRFDRLDGLRLFEGSKVAQTAEVLKPMLDDKEPSVAAMAARILYQGGDERMLEWLVLKSFHAQGDDKLKYEKELEQLRLADDRRRAILAKAGIQ